MDILIGDRKQRINYCRYVLAILLAIVVLDSSLYCQL